MKALLKAAQSSLSQIQNIIEIISREQNIQSENIYASSGIGRHVRHVADHFQAVQKGIDIFLVDYDERHRDSQIETEIEVARNYLEQLQKWILNLNENNIHFVIKSEINCDKQESVKIFSDLERELLYLINHTIHHAAFIKLMLQTYEISIPDEIGIAPGTATYFRQVGKDKVENTMKFS